MLIFQGDHFDFNDKLKRVKNLFIDFFSTQKYKEINIQEMNRVLVFSAINETTIKLEQFEVSSINEALAYTDELKCEKIGPCLTLTIRRSNFCDDETWKQATKVRRNKSKSDKKKKNITTNVLGETRGRVFMQQQDLSTIALRKFK